MNRKLRVLNPGLLAVACVLSMKCEGVYAEHAKQDKDGARAYLRARELASFGEYDEAIEQFNKAIAIKPDTDRYTLRGRCYENMRKYKEAIEDFSTAIKLDKRTYASPYLHRGRCYQKLNQQKEAIADFTRGIEVENSGPKKQSKYFSFYMWRGRSYDLLGQKDKALQDYNKSLEYKGGKIDMATVRMWRDKLGKSKG